MREREILIPCGIIRNVCKFYCVFFLFLFSHSYKLVMSTHIHPTAAHSHTHIFRGVCTVIAKSFNSTLQPKKHLICVLFYRPHSNTTRKWVKAKRKLSMRQKGNRGQRENLGETLGENSRIKRGSG